jgi:hypothetical protein
MLYIHLLLLLPIAACQEKGDRVVLAIDGEQTSFLFTGAGGEESVQINANVTWDAAVAKEGKEWCQTVKQNKATLSIIVLQNHALEGRETKITLSATKASPVELSVRQAGAAPGITFAVDTCRAPAIGGKIRVAVVASVDYEVVPNHPWITRLEKEGNDEIFSLAENSDKSARLGTVLFRQTGGGEVNNTLFLLQAGRDTVYAPGDAGSVTGDIQVNVKSSSASEAHDGEGIERSHDGDLNTIYHSRWGEETHFPVTMTYTFENVDRLDYMVYYPRQDGGSNGNFKAVKVYARTGTETTFLHLSDRDFNGSATPSTIAFSPPLTNPSAIKIEVLSGVGDNVKGFASCAEMKFYKKASDQDFLALFTDQTCSRLKPEVTLEQIQAIENPFIRNMAAYIFHGEYALDARVREYPAYPHPESFAGTNKTNKYGLLDNATGISVALNEEIILFAGDLHGQHVALRVMDFHQGYTGTSYPITEGMNKIKVSNKGLAYIIYHTDTPDARPVKIHIASGSVNGYFDIEKHARGEWKTLLDRAVNTHFDVLGRKVHLLFPVARFQAHCPDIVNLLEVYDRIVELEQEFIGLKKYDRVPPNRVMLVVSYNPDTYMSATDYRTNYNDNTLAELLNVQLLKTSHIWGPAHEIGHVHQTRPGLAWVGLSEVSNNIYSLYVQTSFNNTSRLTADKVYQRGFTDIIVAGIPHAHLGTITKDPHFQKLVPFWQLQLYALILGIPDFYKDLHERVRIDPDKNYTTQAGEIQLDFVRNACDLLNTDLTYFFERWGFLKEIDETVPDYAAVKQTITTAQINALKAEIAARPYGATKAPEGLIYLSDNTVDAFKNRREIVKGTLTRAGTTITMNGWSNVIAFEVYRDGTLVLATPDHSFTIPEYTGTITFKAVAWNGTRVDAQ